MRVVESGLEGTAGEDPFGQVALYIALMGLVTLVTAFSRSLANLAL